ncbi:hypothetical protein BYT27DRAFT_6914088 [Phlegmacium glaucopus]|nr:hypothetical protein BYT27DRAFT_6914088 [Phlegmacium glaucopus]
MPSTEFMINEYRLSREVDDLGEVQRKEEANTQTYKKILATLENISASATTTIEPQLSRSLVAQADCKKVIEEKEKIMQKIWTDAVEAFITDVTREVDVGLQAALISIRQEARQVVYSVPGRSHRRQRDEDDVAHPEEREKKKKDRNTSSEGIIREHKRRRVHEPSPAGLQDDNRGPFDEIYDMKLKIEQQAQMLALLVQENNEVRGIRVVMIDILEANMSSCG